MVVIDRTERVLPDEQTPEQHVINEPQPKEKRRRLRRSLKLLPNLFTLGNAFFGFCTLVLAAHNNPEAAAYCILFGASMDALDGRIARLTQSTSPLGMQLDSLADAVTFIVAPAFMVYMLDFNHGSVWGFLSCAFYMLAGVFRLARFNVTSHAQSTYFLGLPSTIAGCTLALAILSFPLKDHTIYTTLFMVVLGYLMVSNWRFPSFKQASMRWVFSAIIVIGVTTATFGFNRVLLALYGIYLVLGGVSTIRLKLAKKQQRTQQ